MSKKTVVGTAVAAVLCLSLGYAQDKPRGVGSGKAGGTQTSDAKSIHEAERELFGEAGEEDYFDGYTSHFNFDNRVLGQNPPTTNKLRCIVECRLDDGRTQSFTNGDLRRVYVGELDIADVNSHRIRVVQCRFWWKLRPLGDWHNSEWVKARPDHYIVYAFLVWRGQNDYEKPIYFFDEPLADGKSRAEAPKPGTTTPATKKP